MFDLGALGEFLIIVVAVLILFGPKEIPELVRLAGRWVGKIRAITREVQRNIDNVVNEAELEDYRENAQEDFQDEVKENLKNLNPEKNDEEESS